jgi:proteasome lid subunit RPN8/RPN11
MDRVREHLERGYSNEACGALVGYPGDNLREVIEFHSLRNTIDGPLPRDPLQPLEPVHGPWDRYNIDPLEQLRVQKNAEVRGMEIVGFVHSHPDHRAEPSKTDAKGAYGFYSYLVASVEKGTLSAVRCWRFDEAAKTFHEEPLEID